MKSKQGRSSGFWWVLLVLLMAAPAKDIRRVFGASAASGGIPETPAASVVPREGESENEASASDDEESWRWFVRGIRPETNNLRVMVSFFVKTTGHEESFDNDTYATFFLDAIARLREDWERAHPGCETIDAPPTWPEDHRPTSMVIIAECPLYLLGILKIEFFEDTLQTEHFLLEEN